MQNITKEEKLVVKEFFSYAKQICKKLEMLKEFDLEDSYFLEQAKDLRKDFFLNNLFMFHQCLYMSDSEIVENYKKEIKSLYDNITLYHYTTYKTLEKIIAGKSLKLSNITNMNDKAECTALYNYSKPIIDSINTKEKTILEKDFIDYTSKIFSFSFSTLEDDAAQWERYGVKKSINDDNEPSGVCIGIPMTKLSEVVKRIENEFDLAVIAPILYIPNYDKTNSMLDMLIKFAIYKSNKNSEDITKNISQYSAEIKHKSFRKEYEIRLLIAPLLPNIAKLNGSILLELEKYDFNNLFSSIRLGPEVSLKTKNKVKDLLHKNKINTTLKASECTLRFTY